MPTGDDRYENDNAGERKQKGAGDIALDSSCLTYLAEANGTFVEPKKPPIDERKALMWIWLYDRPAYWVTETVIAEYSKIRNEGLRELHELLTAVLICDGPVENREFVDRRTEELLKHHKGQNDCRILAEVEDRAIGVLLTADEQFLRRVARASPRISVMKPSLYWAGLCIPRGASPRMVPDQVHPLSRQTWWRW